MQRTISGLSPARSDKLKSWLSRNQYGTSIDGHSESDFGSIWAATEICRQLSEVGHGLYTKQAIPLFFVPIEGQERNAYAYYVQDANFDVVSITRALLNSVDEFTFFLGRYLMLSPERKVGGSLNFLYKTEGDLKVKVDILGTLIRDGVLAFLIGHELGHLMAGHLAVVHELRNQANFVGADESSVWDEALMASMAKELMHDLEKSSILNALEVDADIQGMDFLARHWRAVFDDNNLSPDQTAIYSDALKTTERRYFISLTCIGIAFLLLGFKPFDGSWMAQPTHPLGATRLLIALKALPSFFHAANGLELIRAEAVESIVLVHSAWAQKLLSDEKTGVSSDASSATKRDADILKVVKSKPSEKKHNYMLSASGVLGAIHASEQMGEYLTQLSESLASTEALRSYAMRTRVEKLKQWKADVHSDELLKGC